MRQTFFQRFLRTEAAGGIVLLAAALAALAVANSPLAGAYDAFWASRLVIGPEGHPLALTARGWVNDGLMAAFFLLVGLEIKRELLVGELSSTRQAALPFAAAFGGVVAPALVYASLAGPDALRGWAIPTATDIAFALGVLALVAPRAPAGLKVFLAALAIVDDMCAVVVIALFYTAEVEWAALAGARCHGRGARGPEPVARPPPHAVCAWIAGIGFTMSLFIAGLAFGESPAFDAAQVGIMGGSAAAAGVGAIVLRRARPGR